MTLTGSEALFRQFISLRRVELERLAFGIEKSVFGRIERKFSREGHGGNDIRRSEEVHSESVTVVASLEVSVERSEDSWKEKITSEGSQYC